MTKPTNLITLTHELARLTDIRTKRHLLNRELLPRLQAYTSPEHFAIRSARYYEHVKRARAFYAARNFSTLPVTALFGFDAQKPLATLLLERFNDYSVRCYAIRNFTWLPATWLTELTGIPRNSLNKITYTTKRQRCDIQDVYHSTCLAPMSLIRNQHRGFMLPCEHVDGRPLHLDLPLRVPGGRVPRRGNHMDKLRPFPTLTGGVATTPLLYMRNGGLYALPRYFVHSLDNFHQRMHTGQIERQEHPDNKPVGVPAQQYVFTLDYDPTDIRHTEVAVPSGYCYDSTPNSPYNHFSLDTLATACACVANRVVAVINTRKLTIRDKIALDELLDDINASNGIAILLTSLTHPSPYKFEQI